MQYEYMSPQEAYRRARAVNPNRPSIKGLRGGPAYWVHIGDNPSLATQEYAAAYDFSLRVIEDVVPGMHAYRIVYAEGGYDELLAHDVVCVATEGSN